MSIRTNPMKAVTVLLKRVKATRTEFLKSGVDESLDGKSLDSKSLDCKMEDLTQELNKIEDVFMRVKENQDQLLDTLHEVDGYLRMFDREKLGQMDGICKRIRDCAHKLLPSSHSHKDHRSSQILGSSSHDSSSSKRNNNELLLAQPVDLTQDMLTFQVRRCLLSLSIFPEDAVIKKRQAIYFWIGLGIVDNGGEKKAEEVGEELIDELLKLNYIVAYANGECPIVNKFQIHPRIRPQLDSLVEGGSDMQFWLVLKQKYVTLGWDYSQPEHPRTVFNVSSSYLNIESQLLDKRCSLEVLQLGRWQDSPSHHIEVGNQDFLNNLSSQTELKYISLRGISRVFELPPSIIKAKSLQILDLKACHNLETLPDDISSMESLTHLILSQCYLLDNMPKGIEKLTQLQVLKGFVLGSSKRTPCKISDLAKLENLRRLSIHIGREAKIEGGEFESLEELSKLQHLKISWGVFDAEYSGIQINLPPSLEKLHLEGFPGQEIPKWLKPSNVPLTLTELSLTGGKLKSMNHDDTKLWDMEIVRLKYLKHLKVDIRHLQELFPLLRYALVKPIPYKSYTELSVDTMYCI